MDKIRTVKCELKLLKQENQYIFPVELWMYNGAVTANNWKFMELELHRPLWAGVPILVAYTNNGNQIGDGHNQRTFTDPLTGETVASFTGANAERIVGSVSDTESEIRLEERNEETWVVAKGFLWTWYARELVEKIVSDARQGRAMSVSIEALVTDYREENGVELELRYQPLGVTVLGDHVRSAVDGAHIAALESMKPEFKELKLRAASYMGEQNGGKSKQKEIVWKKGRERCMNHAQKKELEKKFPDYLIAGASEDGKLVVLASKTGTDVFCYRFEESDKGTVIPERMEATELHGCAAVGGEDVPVDVEGLFADYEHQLSALAAENASFKEKNEKLEARMAEMETREVARRITTSKEAANRALAWCNRDRVEERRFAASDIEDIIRRAEAGEFVNCIDADGNWCGEDATEHAVLAALMKKQSEFDRKDAEERVRQAQRGKTEFIWDKLKTGQVDDGSIDALLSRHGIENT